MDLAFTFFYLFLIFASTQFTLEWFFIGLQGFRLRAIKISLEVRGETIPWDLQVKSPPLRVWGFLAWPARFTIIHCFTFRANVLKDIPFLGQCFFQIVHAVQNSLQKLCVFFLCVAEMSVSYACSDSSVIMVLSFNTTLLNQMCQNSCHRSKFLLNLWGC